MKRLQKLNEPILYFLMDICAFRNNYAVRDNKR